jgi:hypothetical protein
MVDCGSAGVWDRGIKGMWNVFVGSEVYCLSYGDECYGRDDPRIETRVGVQF